MPQLGKGNSVNFVGHLFQHGGEYILCKYMNGVEGFDGIVISGQYSGHTRTFKYTECDHLGLFQYSPTKPTTLTPLIPPTQPVEDIAEIVNVGLRLTGDSASLRVISKIIRIYEACKDNPNYSVKELVRDIKD